MPGSQSAVIASLLVKLGLDPRGVDKGVRSALRSVDKLKGVGRSLTRNLTLPIATVGTAGVAAFARFDQAIRNSASVISDGRANLDALGAAARQAGTDASNAFGASEAAKGLEFFGLAGDNAEKAIGKLPTALRAATAASADLVQTSDLLTDVMAAVGLQVENADQNIANFNRTADVLGKAQTTANANILQFGEALRIAGPQASQLGVSLEEVTAGVASIANSFKGSEAGTKVNRFFIDLTTKALKNAEAFKAAGIEVFNAQGEFAGMANVVEDLEIAMAGLTTEQQRQLLLSLEIPAKTLQATLIFVGQSKAIRELTKEYENAGGAIDALANDRMKGLLNQFTAFKNRVEEAAISLGESLAPIIRDTILPMFEGFVDSLSSAIQWFRDLPAPVSRTAIAFVGLTAAAGPAIIALGALLKLGLVLNPLFAAGGALAIGLGALAIGLSHVEEPADRTGAAIKRMREESEKATKAIDDLSAAQTRLAGTQNQTAVAVASAQLQKLLQERARLEEVFSEFVGGRTVVVIDGVANSAQDVARHIDDVNAKIELVSESARLAASAVEELAEASKKFEADIFGGGFKAPGVNLPPPGTAATLPPEQTAQTLSNNAGGGQNPFTFGQGNDTRSFIPISSEDQEKLDAALQSMREMKQTQQDFIDFGNEAWGQWAARGIEVTTNLKLAALDFVESFSQGLGNAIAQIVVFGRTTAEVLDNLWRTLASQIISTIVQIGVQWLASLLVNKVASATAYSVNLAQQVGLAGASAYASTTAIPIVGPILAPGAATSAISGALASAASGFAAGLSAGAAAGGVGLDTGAEILADGIVTVHKGERVLSEANVQRHNALMSNVRPRGSNRDIVLQVDRQELARVSMSAIAEHSQRLGFSS